jgi:hypothetical protein
MYIQKLREMVPSPNQNTVGFCKEITLLILHYISSRLVTLRKVSIRFNRNPIGARLQIDGENSPITGLNRPRGWVEV